MNEVRSRSSAPGPPTPSPRKPELPPTSPNVPSATTLPWSETPSGERKPLIHSPTIFSHGLGSLDPPSPPGTTQRTRDRSQAPGFEPVPPEWTRQRIKDEGRDHFACFEREPTWLETGGWGDGEDPERQAEAEEFARLLETAEIDVLFRVDDEEKDETLLHGEEQDPDAREIDYSDVEHNDEEDDTMSTVSHGDGRRTLDQQADESEDEDSASEDDQRLRKTNKRTRDSRSGSSIFKKRKRMTRKDILKTEREQEAKEQADRERETSNFLESLGVDPRPTQVSVKARLTNEVAARTTHLPAPHQVQSVKEPPRLYPRPPSPPNLRRRAQVGAFSVEPKRNSASPAADTPDLADNVKDPNQPPPEELVSAKSLEELDVVEEKPKRLTTKAEAIFRWKEETNLLTNGRRPMPEEYSWSSYRQDHEDITALISNASNLIGPLLPLTRTFEAHQDLLTVRPPQSHTLLTWNSIWDPEPPTIDSNSRQARANWQLTNFRDINGTEKLLRQAKQEGIVAGDYETVAKDVFELDPGRKLELGKVADRNWLLAEQIVQIARIKQAHDRLATPEVLETLRIRRQHLTDHFKRETERLEVERNSLAKTVRNSQWILKLGGTLESLKIEYNDSIGKFERLEKNLRARL